MGVKVNGKVGAGSKLGSALNFFTFSTTIDITPGAVGSVTQNRLDKIVEVISLRGQPVLLGTPTFSNPNYVFSFAVEHTGQWTAATLKQALLDHQAAGMGFLTGNVTITGGGENL